MPTAARNFSYGDGEESHKFSVGDEIPESIVEDIPDNLVLEKLAHEDPGALTRDQLMRLAGVGPYSETGEGSEEAWFDEEAFREALGDFKNKAELVEWAAEFYGLDLDASQTRETLENQVVDHASAQYESDEDEE